MNQLPHGLDKVGMFLPISYWLELIRRSFVGQVSEAFPTFVNLTNLHLMLILVGLSIVFGLLGFWVFKLCDHRARERGLIDWSTSY
jgi:ABC-type polysaccharide/polyol phosphate export permease